MSLKRPAEEPIPMERRTRIKLASPSPERTTESDTESIHSCQGYKTELVNDTSDTSSPIPQTEYEIVEAAERRLKYYFSDQTSEGNDPEINFVSVNSSDSLENALLGDTSEENSTSPTSNSDVDPGLPRNDYLDFEYCLLCRTDKKNISYPYCSMCFTWKKNLFPSRPKRCKGSRKRFRLPSQSTLEIKKSNESSQEEEGVVQENKSKVSFCDGLFEDSGVGSNEPQLSEDTVDGPSQPSQASQASTSCSIETSVSNTNSPNIRNFEPCRVCFLKPENGLFVHSKIAHRYGCYHCANEIWYNNGSCPLCRRKVFKVTKLYD